MLSRDYLHGTNNGSPIHSNMINQVIRNSVHPSRCRDIGPRKNRFLKRLIYGFRLLLPWDALIEVSADNQPSSMLRVVAHDRPKPIKIRQMILPNLAVPIACRNVGALPRDAYAYDTNTIEHKRAVATFGHTRKSSHLDSVNRPP